jgi:uncharacterized membrane protein YvlD (DUF360 family)
MRNLVVRAAAALVVSAVALTTAAVLLDGMTLTLTGIVVAAAIFMVLALIVRPLSEAVVKRFADALSSGIGLVSTFLTLLLTATLTDGLTISGTGTWILATVIVWLAVLVLELAVPRLFGLPRREA